MKPDYKLVAKAKYIHANADLASEIWHEVYKPITLQSSWTRWWKRCRAPMPLRRISTTM